MHLLEIMKIKEFDGTRKPYAAQYVPCATCTLCIVCNAHKFSVIHVICAHFVYCFRVEIILNLFLIKSKLVFISRSIRIRRNVLRITQLADSFSVKPEVESFTCIRLSNISMCLVIITDVPGIHAGLHVFHVLRF